MKCTRGVVCRRMNVALNGKLLEVVECFEYLRSKIIVDRARDTEMKSRINDVGKVLGGIKVLSFRIMGTNVKRRFYL